MIKLKCSFNKETICEAKLEYFHSKSCIHDSNGLCNAKPEDLMLTCPDCGYTHNWGKCDIKQKDTLVVPKIKPQQQRYKYPKNQVVWIKPIMKTNKRIQARQILKTMGCVRVSV